MDTFIVVEDPKRWKLHLPGTTIIRARDYLADDRYSMARNAKVLNLCESYRYQTTGYYVSLVAAARGHYPMPSVLATQDMRLDSVIRRASHELDMQIQRSLKTIHGTTFELSVYFGKNVAKSHNRLAKELFEMFPMPFFRADFIKEEGHWVLDDIHGIAARDIPEIHHAFVVEQITQFFGRKVRTNRQGQQTYRYEMAILRTPDDPTPPSNAEAIEEVRKAAERNGVGTELIDRNDIGQLDRYDALFIRDTTAVNNYTYRFARRAEASGQVVIDDPLSILRCGNKIYLAELMRAHRIPTPLTLVFNKFTAARVKETIGFPCVLKIPDSSYSLGVSKCNTEEEFEHALPQLFKSSELLLAQVFLPTEFDWRVGILNRQPLYVCRYYMAGSHWQIYNHTGNGDPDVGMADTLAVGEAPPSVIDTAMQAAGLIGNGLYGVDLKEIDGKPIVIEVNDNPSIDAGIEDDVLKTELYNSIVREFIRRLDASHGK